MTEENAPAAGNAPDTASQAPAPPVPSSEEQKKMDDAAKKLNASVKRAAASVGSGAKALWGDPLVCTKHFDRLLDWMQSAFSPEMFLVISRLFARLGQVSLVVAAFVGAVFEFTTAIREESFYPLLYGSGFVLLLAVVQYTAYKFLDAGERLIASAPSVLTSPAFLRCVALVGEASALIVFFWYLTTAIKAETIDPFWVGLGLSILCEAISCVAIHLSLANIRIDPGASAGEEAIGISSFFAKALMRLVPILFGTGAALGTVALIISTVSQISSGDAAEQASYQARTIIASGLLPFVAYIAFASFCLGIDLLRAILHIPRIGRTA